MDLFTAFKHWLSSHTVHKRATTYLVAALLVVMTVAVPAGTLTAQAEGLSNSASCPQFTVTPTQDAPQKPVYVKGSGFVPSNSKNVAVELYNLSNKQYQFIKDVTPTNGCVITHFTLPIDPGGQYYVVAYQQSSGVQEQALFTIIPGFTSLKPAKNIVVGPVDPLCAQYGWSPPPGNPLTLGAAGLPASTSYQVEWENKNTTSTTEMASGTTTTSGTMSASFNVPAETAGNYYLFVITSYGPFPIVTYYSGTYGCYIATEPGDGYIHFLWDGEGWDADSTVAFGFNGSRTASTDTKGSFGTQGFLQKCPSPGTYPVTDSGMANGQPFSFTFPIWLTVVSSC